MNGLEAWQEVIRAGWEGLVAKDPESPYVGGRTLKWLNHSTSLPGARAARSKL